MAETTKILTASSHIQLIPTQNTIFQAREQKLDTTKVPNQITFWEKRLVEAEKSLV